LTLSLLESNNMGLYREALKLIPSGVSSHMRLMPEPIYAVKGFGSKIVDVDGNTYIDYLLAFGALINGHSHPEIVEAIRGQAEKLLMSGLPHELEIEVARKVSACVPNAEMVLFAVTGTEATMEAVRIARAVTGKNKILKFEGAYHGHHDYVLWSLGPYSMGLEIAPYRLPGNAGIPEAVGKTVVIAPWNEPESLRKIVRRHRASLAAIIAEPVMANNGVIPPKPGFLKELREIADENEMLLIFDEVFTGFRLSLGGAMELYGVKPDIATFAKALGGGVPISAITGSRKILENVRPGRISFGGTYNAHPISLAAASANLDILMRNGGEALRRMFLLGEKLAGIVREAVEELGLNAVVQGVGPMFQIFFTDKEAVWSLRDLENVSNESYTRLHHELLKRGVLIHHELYERITLSTAHTEEDMEKTGHAFREALREVKHHI
jgi:glutamate-1-semialdehyde 2,1-aminomutase